MRRLFHSCTAAMLLVASAGSVQAQSQDATTSDVQTLSSSFAFGDSELADAPILFAAENVSFDTQNQFLRAWGNVEINQSGRTIRADELYYDAEAQELRALGNIFLIDKTGSRLTADEIALNTDFTRGFIRQVQMNISPNIRIAATYAERRSETETNFYQGVLSPCPACEDNPDKKPIWQIKADQIRLDGDRELVYYKNARFELLGLPVFFLPFAAHADPSRPRQSGWLLPDGAFGSDVGLGITGQYYLDITEATDATVAFTPYVGGLGNSTNSGRAGLGGLRADVELRQALPGGRVEANVYSLFEMPGSYLDENFFQTGDPEINAGADLSLSWAPTDNTRIRGKGHLWSNRTFFDALDIDNSEVISDELEGEAFLGRSYINLYGETNRPTRLGITAGDYPVFGKASTDVLTEPFWGAVTASLQGDMRHIERSNGRDYSRGSVGAQVRAPFTLPGGQRFSAEIGAVGALYQVEGTDTSALLVTSPGTPDFSGNVGRIQPRVALNWSLPLAKTSGVNSQVIEPLVSLVYAGPDSNTGEIPNEDSLAFELGEFNLFDTVRTTGIDFVDAGARLNYGLKYNIERGDDFSISTFIGQSFDFIDDDGLLDGARPNGGGVEDQLSHLVGGLTWKVGDRFSGNWQGRIDAADGKLYRNDLNAKLDFNRFSLSGAYEFYRADDASSRLERASVDGTFRFSDTWSVSAGYSDDLSVSYLNSFRAGIDFTHPCLIFGVEAERRYDINGTPDDSIGFNLDVTLLTQTLGQGFDSLIGGGQ